HERRSKEELKKFDGLYLQRYRSRGPFLRDDIQDWPNIVVFTHVVHIDYGNSVCLLIGRDKKKHAVDPSKLLCVVLCARARFELSFKRFSRHIGKRECGTPSC